MQKGQNRSTIIIRSGGLFILTNFLLAILNVIVGLSAHSVAIVSDSLHSLIDATSGLLVIISEKIAKIQKFAHQRANIERVTTVLIALIIIGVGIHIVIESIEKILEPSPVNYTLPTIIILVISIAAKIALALYLKVTGNKVKSEVLVASGAETMNDALISVAVLFSAIVYLIWQLNIEAYVSLIISAIIIKVGLEFIFPHLSHHHHHPLEQDPSHGQKPTHKKH